MKIFNFFLLLIFFLYVSNSPISKKSDYIQVLGTIQDAGFPHIGCEKDCCEDIKPGEYFVSCLGLVDRKNNKRYLFDATPDIHHQLRLLESSPGYDLISGIFLTHAHVGHYSGLMYLGREGLGGNNIRVYALERMSNFLQNNGPWDQLVSLNNILIEKIQFNDSIKLSKHIKIIPIKVPHRDEYSETAGYKIFGKTNKVLFIPDIDKWSEWEKSIVEEVKMVDYAFIDGTFFNGIELKRDMQEIPHPSIEETIKLFSNQPIGERKKIYFIHMNHTNPILVNKNGIKDTVEGMGFNIAKRGLKIYLD